MRQVLGNPSDQRRTIKNSRHQKHKNDPKYTTLVSTSPDQFLKGTVVNAMLNRRGINNWVSNVIHDCQLVCELSHIISRQSIKVRLHV